MMDRQMQCPECGNTEKFQICADVWGEVTEDGFNDDSPKLPDGGAHWNDHNGARCGACFHAGTVGDFDKAHQDIEAEAPEVHTYVVRCVMDARVHGTVNIEAETPEAAEALLTREYVQKNFETSFNPDDVDCSAGTGIWISELYPEDDCDDEYIVERELPDPPAFEAIKCPKCHNDSLLLEDVPARFDTTLGAWVAKYVCAGACVCEECDHVSRLK